jgi:hypothetical protein
MVKMDIRSMILSFSLSLLLAFGALLRTSEAGLLNPAPRWRHSPQVVRPLVSIERLNDQSWSNRSAIFKRGNRLSAYHNYTVHANEVQWTKREQVTEKALQRRGNILADDTFYWSHAIFADTNNIAWIPLCYENQLSLDKLHLHVQQAVNKWHDKLGCKSGVRFNSWPDSPRVCSGPQGMHIIYVPDFNFRSSSTVGARADPTVPRGAPRHYLKLEDPDRFHDPVYGLTYVWMVTHELGEFFVLEE